MSQEDEQVTEENEELVDTQKHPVDGQLSPRLNQILEEQEEEESISAKGSAEKEEEQAESPPISTECKILVEACTQTEDPSITDASMETTSFQELKETWWKEYEESRGEAWLQQKGIWFSYAYKNWQALEQAKAQYKEIKQLKARLSRMFELV